MRRHIIWVALLAVSLPTVQAQSAGPNSTAEESGFFVENLLERAEQGDTWAQSVLGLMYATGQGVPENSITAYAWINVAAAQGVEKAKDARETIKKTMTQKSIAEHRSCRTDIGNPTGPTARIDECSDHAGELHHPVIKFHGANAAGTVAQAF